MFPVRKSACAIRTVIFWTGLTGLTGWTGFLKNISGNPVILKIL
jgi:hypothetical protein